MIPFANIKQAALARARDLLQQWFPAGTLHGDEFHIGDVTGEPGHSLKINWRTGLGADFATGDCFGDLIDLYAAHMGISVKEAALQLGNIVGLHEAPRERAKAARRVEVQLPPSDADIRPQVFSSAGRGMPAEIYAYRSRAGRLRYVIARYDPDDSRGRTRKEFTPFVWAGDTWMPKAPPAPRPLYGLELIDTYPNQAAVIVEGERCANVARGVVWASRPVLTWSGGAGGVQHADWSELAGLTDVVIWPDADKPGIEAGAAIARILAGMGITVSIVDVADVMVEVAAQTKPSGWDIADMVAAGATKADVVAFVKARKKPYIAQAAVLVNPEVESEPPPPPESFESLWARHALTLDGKGRPDINLDNVVRIITANTTTETLHFDPFLNQIKTDGHRLDDAWILAWQLRLQRAYGLVGLQRSGVVADAIAIVAKSRRVNSLQVWLRSLEWDQKPRLETMLSRGFCAADTDYTRAVSRCFLLSLAARAIRPGCQVDTMLILEGRQGAGKSRGLEALAGPEFYADIDSPIGTQQHAQDIQGRWLVEISELSGMRASDVERVKSGITRTTDVYREPYARVATDHPRQCVYAGTTNSGQYLLDDTGNRRFWPVRVGDQIDKGWLSQTREQLFAEAVARLDQGAVWWDVPDDAHREAVALRVVLDALDVRVHQYLERLPGPVVTADILAFLEIPLSQWTTGLQRRVGAALRSAGWHVQRERGRQVWYPSETIRLRAVR